MIIIPTPKELGFFFASNILHFTKKQKFTFPLSQFPSYKYEICDQNSITDSLNILRNFDLSDF